MQVALLRVLQEKTVMRVGGTDPIKVNFRIISATNKNLEELVQNGDFRKDLFYRVNTITLHLPPLRERPEDISHLIKHFIEKHSHKDIKVSSEALDLLMSYEWPGNIRELEHVIERALILQEDNMIKPENIPVKIKDKISTSEFPGIIDLPWKEASQRFEKHYIQYHLENSAGNISETAKISGIDRADLYKKIKRLGIKR